MSRHEDAALPGAYLRDHIAPYVDAGAAAIAQATTLVQKYEAAMRGCGGQTIPQIATVLGMSTDAVRAYLHGKLQKQKLVESKAGEAPIKGGPTPALWYWVG